jgi:hypothetical protein
MRFGLVAVVGLMVAAGAWAQQGAVVPDPQGGVKLGQANASTAAAGLEVQRRYAVVGVGCPGDLQARQQATGGATVWTTALEDEHGARPSGLGVHVVFVGEKTAVKALELRVSYLPLGLRRMLVSPTVANVVEASPQERAKTFDLDREAAMRIGGNLLVGPAATITRVHLVSLTYADGSMWHASSDDQCSIVPNRVMEVATK